MKLFILLSLVTCTLHIKERYINHKGKLQTGISACTGVFVGPNTVLTAAHCVRESTGYQWAKTNDGKVFDVSIIARNPDEDLALLRVNIKPHPYVSLGREVQKTDHVYTVNSGQDLQDTYGEGVVENIVSLEEIHSPGILHSIAIFGGASGSGLFNRKGKLVGINILKQGAVSFAVNIPAIATFLHENHIN